MSVEWLRRRVARFIYGVNGTDIPDVGLLSTVQLTRKNSQVGGVTGTDVILADGNTDATACEKTAFISSKFSGFPTGMELM